MRRDIVLVALVVVILLTAVYVSSTELRSHSSTDQASTSSDSLGPYAAAAAGYLIRGYNATVGLIPATPGSDVYWVYSDNFLASLALSQYGDNNATAAKLAEDISVSVEDYLPIASTWNQYMTLDQIPCSYPSAANQTISVSGGASVATVVNYGPGTLSPSQYADIAFLDAICLYHSQSQAAAIALYEEGARMFNGIGLVDLPFNETQQYQTYKLALFIYASSVLGQPVSSTALSTLLMMQAPDGGFYTGYSAGYSHGETMTNTETTSLALLALENV